MKIIGSLKDIFPFNVIVFIATLIYRIIVVGFTIIYYIIIAVPISGVVFAFVISIVYFVRSIIENANPYTTYVDNNKNAPGRRNFFFGPGFHSIDKIIKNTFSDISSLVAQVKTKVFSFKVGKSFFVWILPVVFFYCFAICTYVFGFLFCTILSLLLLTVILAMMTCFFLAFSFLWGADRLYLLLKSINCRCPVDKRKFIVPKFKCPQCNNVFSESLTPGPYGVFHINCPSCKNKLPTTVFNGRSKLDAVCPACGTDFASGTSVQFGIQCVGNTQSGKTSFLAAFFHELFENENHKMLNYTKIPETLFNNLERMFNKGKPDQTTDNNAAMYSIVYHGSGLSDFQFSIYDIAGEAFNDIRKENQKQFDYAEGFFFLVNPDEDANETLNLYSKFVGYLRSSKNINTKKTIHVPIAIIITKADAFKFEIDPLGIAIRASTNKAPEIVNASYEEKLTFTRVNACKDFLRKNGLNNLINLLERDFSKYSYFSVSAIGHEQISNVSFEPRGTLEPVKWIVKQSNNLDCKKLFDSIF